MVWKVFHFWVGRKHGDDQGWRRTTLSRSRFRWDNGEESFNSVQGMMEDPEKGNAAIRRVVFRSIGIAKTVETATKEVTMRGPSLSREIPPTP